MSNLPKPPSDGPDLNVLLTQTRMLVDEMQTRGIKSIDFTNGPRAEHDPVTNTTRVAAPGIIIEDRNSTTSIHLIKSGADPQEALQELRDQGQKQTILAAAHDTSQPTISRNLTKIAD